MNKRIAYLIAGELFDKKGLVNTVLTKVQYLKKCDVFETDVFFIQTYWGWLARKLKPDTPPKLEKKKVINVDGIAINVIWKPFSFVDYILSTRMGKAPFFERFFIRNVAKRIKGYDLSSAHSLACSEIAMRAKEKYGVPYVSSWYGSDIHSVPFENEFYRKKTVKAMENAEHNFMCSKDLWRVSERLSTKAKRSLLYNGVRPSAHKYNAEEREEIRHRYNFDNKKIVAFAGGFIEVKNPLALPEIYKVVDDLLPGTVEFWLIGNGKLLPQVEQKLQGYQLRYKKWGYVSDDTMLDLLNCIDVIVLPSINEGLPLITIEGLACGANVVGSRVGGIPEAIGIDNTVELGEQFAVNVAKRIVEMLDGQVKQDLDSCFFWDNISKLEREKYSELLNQ